MKSNIKKGALVALALSPIAAFAEGATTDIASAQTTVQGYITTVSTVAGGALVIAGGAALVMVVIKYVRRAGK